MSKKLKIGILTVVAVSILAAAGMYFWPKSYLKEQPSANLEIHRNLTAEERKIYEDRLAQGWKILNQYNNSATSTPADFFKVYMYLGFQYSGLGKISLAEQAYKKAVEFEPGNYNAYTALYMLYLEIGANQKALEAIQKAITLAPDKPDVWRKLVELKRDKLGASNEELNQIFQEAIKKTNEHLDVITFYAQFLENIGSYQKSWELWNVVSNHYPNNQLYREQVQRLEEKLTSQQP